MAIDRLGQPRVDLPCVEDAGAGDFPYYDIGPTELSLPGPCTDLPRFIRGDSNGDGQVDVSDAVHVLLVLFAGLAEDCADAGDVNDDGNRDVTDPVVLLSFLFLSGDRPRPPFPESGVDPGPDDGLECARR